MIWDAMTLIVTSLQCMVSSLMIVMERRAWSIVTVITVHAKLTASDGPRTSPNEVLTAKLSTSIVALWLLTHWGRDEMATNFLTTISKAFSWMKICKFRLGFHWILFPTKNIPALVQIMAWCRPGGKPLSEPMVVSLLTHICGTRPQCVKIYVLTACCCCMKQMKIPKVIIRDVRWYKGLHVYNRYVKFSC